MTDIAKCHGHRCPDRERCWRYTAPWGEWQSWCDFDHTRKDDHCDSFWPVVAPMPKIKVSRPSRPRGQLDVLLASIMAAGVPKAQALAVIGSP